MLVWQRRVAIKNSQQNKFSFTKKGYSCKRLKEEIDF